LVFVCHQFDQGAGHGAQMVGMIRATTCFSGHDTDQCGLHGGFASPGDQTTHRTVRKAGDGRLLMCGHLAEESGLLAGDVAQMT
jgi:hypothetical protein